MDIPEIKNKLTINDLNSIPSVMEVIKKATTARTGKNLYLWSESPNRMIG